ncbi:ABC-type transport system permease [Heliothis virescens ascovirus 3g]|nr:ABC-type transport system permease [Heliothis virescens ascovirus 3g]AFV50346.1 ABC-type transport system permease [Heliothis virescens ascovirus 3g]
MMSGGEQYERVVAKPQYDDRELMQYIRNMVINEPQYQQFLRSIDTNEGDADYDESRAIALKASIRSGYNKTMDFVRDRALGVTIGTVDAMSTGAMAALVNSGDGFWIVGAISQLCGFFVGGITGALFGVFAGVLIGGREMRKIVRQYRVSFGTNKFAHTRSPHLDMAFRLLSPPVDPHVFIDTTTASIDKTGTEPKPEHSDDGKNSEEDSSPAQADQSESVGSSPPTKDKAV